MTSNLQAIAELLALGFVNSLVEGTVICLLAALALRIAPRQNAATRFAVWFLALVTIAALPWMGGLLPHPARNVAFAQPAAITLPDSWAFYFLTLWGAAAIWFVLGLARALRHLHILRSKSIPVDASALDPMLQKTLQRHGASRRIVLCTSDHVKVPTAVGLFKPVILVPSCVMRELSASELNQIVLHELAHFRRWDDWTNLAQQIVKAIFFFHPAMWWIDRKVALEREMACDDAVLAETRSPRAYAECLAHLAEMSFVRRSIALAQAALGKVRQTSARIAEILDVNRQAPDPRSRTVAVSLIVVLAVACGAFYSSAPRLVAFGGSERAPQTETASASLHSTLETASIATLPATQAKLSLLAVPAKLNAMPAKLNHKSAARRTAEPERPHAQEAKAHNSEENSVHLAGFASSTQPVTQVIWFVVESDGSDSAALQVYQIQMWRVTVLRTVITAPSGQVPRSET